MFRRFASTLLSVLIVTLPAAVFAEPLVYKPLVNLPRIQSDNPTLVGYLNTIFMLSIAIAAIVAVFRITLAGFSYMIATDRWASKEEANTQIWAVITGLVVLLLAFIILQQINPALVELKILK